MKIILENRASESVAIEVLVKVGSNHEGKLKGIAHFIEHMLFEGTKTRTSLDIANEIEAIGGEFNAGTSNEYTIYYIHIQKKHLDIAIDVLSDIVVNPSFSQDAIEKQRKVVSDEINLVTDEPRFHQWILFQQALYRSYPSRFPVYGDKESIMRLTRDDLLAFYKEHYTPANMIISLVGDIDKGAKSKIEKAFVLKGRTRKAGLDKVETLKKSATRKEKKPLMQSYMVFGYPAVKRSHKDSYVLDVMRAILGRGQSGRLFQEIRTKQGLAYEVGVHYESSVYTGFFAVYVNTHKENIPKIIKIIKRELKKLDDISPKDLKDAKDSIEGSHVLKNEDNRSYAEDLAFWDYAGGNAKDFIKNIKRVTKKDILRVRDSFKKSATAIIESLGRDQD